MKKIETLLLFAAILLQLKAVGNNTATYKSNIKKNIYEYINKLNSNDTLIINEQKIISSQLIKQMYLNANYKALWRVAQNRKDIIKIFENAYYEGLNPNDYSINYIKQYHKKRNSKIFIKSEDIAKADIIITNALINYINHMVFGKVNPLEINKAWNFDKRTLPDSLAVNLLNKLKNKNVKDIALEVRSKLPLYKKLKFWFSIYDEIQKGYDTITEINYTGTTLKLGDNNAVIAKVKKRLAKNNRNLNIAYNSNFDESLHTKLKEFQMQNSLVVDGIIGKETIKMLNTTVEDKINILRVNMERCRWLNNNFPNNFIMVNIADFNLYLIKNKKLIYNTKVVVGKKYHKTPSFTEKIKYVVFNPTWFVPNSIATNEILPKVQKQPEYLKRTNISLLFNDTIIDPFNVDFNLYSKDNFPFSFRQKQGVNNALGLVKFIFPNNYNVYLHDTPAKKYFNETNRAFSHGCVRVQNALTLAQHVLNNKNYTKNKIDNIISTKEITKVFLDKPLQVMIMYWTCYDKYKSGKIYFYKDVYGRDELVLQKLGFAD